MVLGVMVCDSVGVRVRVWNNIVDMAINGYIL